MNGFAVDENGLLYVGQEHEIVVFDGDVRVHTITPRTSRTYKFTIEDGDRIVLSTSTKVYDMDLTGKILSESIDEGTKVYNQLQHKKSFLDENGVSYTLEFPWGRTSIYKEGERIYQMPLLDYVVRILLMCMFIGVFIIGTAAAVLRVKGKTGDNRTVPLSP